MLPSLHSRGVGSISRAKDPSRLRQRLRQNEEARREHVNTLLGSGALIAGSLVDHGRRCGTPNCHCETGEKHYSKVLSRKVEGKTHHTHVPAGDEVDVSMKWTEYRRFRRARVALLRLAAQTALLGDQLQAALAEPYPPVDRLPTRRRRGPNARQR